MAAGNGSINPLPLGKEWEMVVVPHRYQNFYFGGWRWGRGQKLPPMTNQPQTQGEGAGMLRESHPQGPGIEGLPEDGSSRVSRMSKNSPSYPRG